MLIDDLNAARIGKPFEILGLQPREDGSFLMRAYLPGAKAVDVLNLKD